MPPHWQYRHQYLAAAGAATQWVGHLAILSSLSYLEPGGKGEGGGSLSGSLGSSTSGKIAWSEELEWTPVISNEFTWFSLV